MSLISDMPAQEHVSTSLEVSPGKILIVTSCTKDKRLPDGLPQQQQLLPKDLWDEGTDDRAERDFGALEQYRIPAGQLYKGQQHLQLMQGVKLLRQVFGHEAVDVKIISAGFGLVDEDQALPPYNATFADQSTAAIATLTQRLGIPQKVNQLMQEDYACAFFLLGESYLLSMELPFQYTPGFPCLFLAGPSTRKRVPRRSPYRFVRVGQDDSAAFRRNLITLKGYLFKLFAEQIVHPLPSASLFPNCATRRERLQCFFDDPSPRHFLEIVSSYRHAASEIDKSTKTKATQSSLFPLMKSLEKPEAKNYGRPMRYFIPDWDDLVDPGYDFVKDQGTSGKRKYYDEVYAHQIYAQSNYDGLLFSKCTVEDGAFKTSLTHELGIHGFGRFRGPILGDCGAFSYINDEVPPYQTGEILEYYQKMGFDYGVSIDHLIIPAFYPVKEFRYQLTRENAREFIQLHRAGGYTFTPVGVAQGWSPETYKQAVIELLDWGYQYIGLGGLARANTKEVYDVVKAIAPVLREDTDVHLFGVARDREGEEMEMFRRLGVTSFDSASYLRRAWLSATTNYFTEDGKRYAALRISPVYESSPRVRKLVAEGIATLDQLKQLEQDALQAVRAYDRGELDLETALDILLEIDRLEEYNYDQHKILYRQVLEDQPWKRCNCEVCRDLGVEVVIFRSNDRNRRRGFHNTYVFYKRFRALLEKARP